MTCSGCVLSTEQREEWWGSVCEICASRGGWTPFTCVGEVVSILCLRGRATGGGGGILGSTFEGLVLFGECNVLAGCVLLVGETKSHACGDCLTLNDCSRSLSVRRTRGCGTGLSRVRGKLFASVTTSVPAVVALGSLFCFSTRARCRATGVPVIVVQCSVLRSGVMFGGGGLGRGLRGRCWLRTFVLSRIPGRGCCQDIAMLYSIKRSAFFHKLIYSWLQAVT